MTEPRKPTRAATAALDKAVAAAMDHARRVQHNQTPPREFAAYEAGFRAGWAARTQRGKPK